jgi:hypothetical protein
MRHRYTIAAPGRQMASEWEQTIVFAEAARYFASSDSKRWRGYTITIPELRVCKFHLQAGNS